MFQNLDIFQMASGLAKHASSRQEVIAKNIANADTPEYRAQDIASFQETYQGAQSQSSMKASRAGHLSGATPENTFITQIDAADPSSPNGNTVALETEMMKATEVRHQHDLAMSVYKSSMNILRTSLGR
ncbi:flagellar basal-body rod protein FlgB [Pacificibacter maritimus]|uniref:Flagellar basal body rod protein FlgB n=1 Tax=Pacificibacter maritimus TaxID=762213 RepID=A0A3N4U274_9RHOB|nr:FlgB family protein [Pacificibacter maritimus]RPE64612.1 flagellar basal-body rod protein FlgB [Pacificibacter maritimus]